MARYPRVLRVIAFRVEWIIGNAAQTGIAAINAGGFLVRVRVGRIEHQAATETAFNLSLVRVRLAVSIISKANEIVSKGWIRKARKIGERRRTVSVVRGARYQWAVCNSIPISVLTRTPGSVTWAELVQVSTPDEPVRGDTEV